LPGQRKGCATHESSERWTTRLTTDSFKQKERGMMVYPARGWRKLFFRAPLFLWRLGLGWILARFHFLVLTTTGRRTGQVRHTMLEYSAMNGRIYISPGWGHRTRWYLNILSDPRVTAQCRGFCRGATARRVTDDAELAELYRVVRGKSPVWEEFLDSWGVQDTYEDFVAKKDRLITLRLDPTEDPTPPPLKPDLLWIWPALFVAILLILLGARR
jgi:deazaflavin-dependent oxidoreductase (nitroreductase family)